ncbi:hypothetical protein MAP_0808 [Mycobacterium avium subsp. paratuberculosis K-10]|uniref:Uncharacterized protein n=1 Tax=Mycolicibacterium paratuberculosis (strain ATCC BAA-968 / K-10) TaxID=262316 RepID=Q742M7_MYCPA|nr:hypothetical protein MAP_0808 [Mycobacterium avium subsp. paratuberculosis K-10]
MLTRSSPARASPAGQSHAVGGQRDLRAGPQCGRRGHHLFEVAGQQRLAAGEPHAGDPQPGDRDAHQPGQLVGGQQLFAGQPVEALGGHAVTAPQVAAIGQRDPQIGGDAPIGVAQRAARRRRRGKRAVERPGRRSGSAWSADPARSASCGHRRSVRNR